MKIYVNFSTRYGDARKVDVGYYDGLNPDGIFEEDTDGIYELVDKTEWERIAEPFEEFTIVQEGTTDDITHMVEGCDVLDVKSMGAVEYVTSWVESAINAINISPISDEDVFKDWKEESGEYEIAVNYITQWVEDHESEKK